VRKVPCMSSSGTTQSKTKMSVFGGFRFAKMEKKNDVSLPDDSTGSVTPSSAPACPMRAFGFRVHTGVPLTNRLKMGAGSSRGAVVTRASSSVPEGLSDGCTGAPVPAGAKLPIVCGEDVMSPKKHGTTDTAVQENLRWGCEWKTADKICSFNRHYVRASAPSQLQSCSRTTFSGTCFKERFFSRKCLETRLVLFLSLPDAPQFPPCHPPPKKTTQAEFAGYWATTDFLAQVDMANETTYYDSVSGKPLFVAPRGRTMVRLCVFPNNHVPPA